MRTTGFVFLLATTVLAGDASKYTEDFEFIRDTVKQHGAALRIKSKAIDWKAACARLRPLFKRCTDDVQHVRNAMRLLAVLRDSHTGVTRFNVDGKLLPGKWDGLYGGGLWIGWDDGLCFVQGIMKGHTLQGTIPLGSVVCTIEGEPAWLAMEREKRRMTTYQGTSTDHSLFCSSDNRFLPFGERRVLQLVFLTPEGKTKKAAVPRWGPKGKAFYPSRLTLPDGLKWQQGAVSTFLKTRWSKKVGYLRITGSMDAATVTAFHAALDRLEGMQALLLDCRRMGGGSDGCAWEMAARFYPKGFSNGTYGKVKPTGTWQFDGPVVMLQDEVEVSSAETFTWAMAETERCVSVGRRTGGWGIIPKGYDCPSKILSFRLGVNWRPTPIKRIQTEGAGWPADVAVPYGPVLCAQSDPVFEIGMQALRAWHEGLSRKKVVAVFHAMFHGKPGPKDPARKLAKLARKDLEARLAMELALLKLKKDHGPIDALGVSRRLEKLAVRAKAAGLKGALARLQKAVKALQKEIAAQKTFLEMTDASFGADPKKRKSFLSRHKKSAIARFAKERYWR